MNTDHERFKKNEFMKCQLCKQTNNSKSVQFYKEKEESEQRKANYKAKYERNEKELKKKKAKRNEVDK